MVPIIVVVVPALTGFLLTSLLWRHEADTRLDPFTMLGLRVSIGFGLGIGICSYLAFVMQALNFSPVFGIASVEVVLLACLLVAYRRRARTFCDLPADFRTLLSGKPGVGLYGALAMGMSGVVVVTTILAKRASHGGWDAFAIWNMRARFINRAGGDWVESTFASDLAWSNPDYPLLIPMSVVRGWRYLGVESQDVPIWVAGGFIVATIALLVFGSGLLSTREQGAVAGLLVVGTPFFIIHGMSQYADVALSFFVLAAVILCCLGLHTPGRDSLEFWVLAGCVSALAAWTKNEGILVALAVAVSATAISMMRSGWKETQRVLACFVCGGLPGIIVLVYFKGVIATPNVLVSGQTLGAAPEKILTLDRYIQTLDAFGLQALTFGEWLVHPVLPVLAYCVAFGFAFRRRVHETMMVALTLCSIVVGFFAVYITTPHNLAYHLDSSLNRLLLQLWPTLVLFFCLVTNGVDRLHHGVRRHEH